MPLYTCRLGLLPDLCGAEPPENGRFGDGVSGQEL